jgi:hypothetical protein
MRTRMRYLWGMLLVGMLCGALSGCSHDPNHAINRENARKAADRINPPPPPDATVKQGHGG